MKILITSDWYTAAVNGVVTSIVNLRRQLEAQGHEVRVLTLAGALHTYQRDGVYYLGSVDAGLIYPGARLRSLAVGQVVEELTQWRPDVVHSQCEFSTFSLAKRIARAAEAPLVHTYHTVYEDYTHYFSPSRRWGKRLAAAFSRWVLEQTDGVIAPTQKVKALLESYGVTAPIWVVPTGIDLAPFAAPQPPQRRDALKSRLGIPAKNKVLLYLGRLAKEKNVEELLECRAGLEGDITLLIVGGGPEQARLEERAAQLGIRDKVVFTGMVPPDQVADYYHLGDVFVSASSSETQGLTYAEALAAGLPAVCRADPCLEGVIQNGRNGWQYQSREELTAHLRALLTDEEGRRAMAGRAALSAQRFSAQRFGQTVEEIYAKTLWRRPAGLAVWEEGSEGWRRA